MTLVTHRSAQEARDEDTESPIDTCYTGVMPTDDQVMPWISVVRGGTFNQRVKGEAGGLCDWSKAKVVKTNEGERKVEEEVVER